jgi:Hint domain
MATFTWAHGTTADWNVTNDWSAKKGTIPPPGSTSADIDTATLGSDKTAYAVTVSLGETFDIAALNISGDSENATTGLTIAGALYTDTVTYGGDGNDAPITVSDGGLLDIRNGIGASNQETITISGAGSGGQLEFGSASTSGIRINDTGVSFSFSNNPAGLNAGEIEFNGPSFVPGSTANQAITNVAAGDKFVFDGASFTNDAVSLAPDGVLTVTDAQGDTILTMNHVAMADGVLPAFQASGDTIVDTAPCYRAGTHILTPSGEVLIEKLTIGDLVVTRSGEARPIRWIGRRSYLGRFIAGNREVLPIRITAGALADGIPLRDLDVSPGHAILRDGVLIPAEKLINEVNIRQIEDVDSIEYIHLELDTHDVIFAEGAQAETYVECDNRNKFQNGREFGTLYPDGDAPKWAYCAPWVADGEVLAQVRQKLDDRLESLGFTTTQDPALRLLVDGCRISPDVVEGSTYLFRLTEKPDDVRILSRTSIPAAIGAGDDKRRLGVNVSSLTLRSDVTTITVEHTHPLLTEGFHRAEATHRWTDGNARIPPEFLACFEDNFIIEVRLLNQGLAYRVACGLPPEPSAGYIPGAVGVS